MTHSPANHKSGLTRLLHLPAYKYPFPDTGAARSSSGSRLRTLTATPSAIPQGETNKPRLLKNQNPIIIRNMSSNKAFRLLSATLLGVISSTASLSADTIRYEDYSGPKVIDSVIVIEETPERVEYLRFIPGQHVLEAWISDSGAMSVKPGTIRVEKSTPEEMQALLDALPKANVTRRMGPPVTLCAPGFYYPLPSRVNYLMGSPTPMRATGLFAGETQDDAIQVHFKDVSTMTFSNNGKKVKVHWKTGEKQASPVLQGWEYQGGTGEAPVLFGVNASSGTYETFPFRELKSIEFP